MKHHWCLWQCQCQWCQWHVSDMTLMSVTSLVSVTCEWHDTDVVDITGVNVSGVSDTVSDISDIVTDNVHVDESVIILLTTNREETDHLSLSFCRLSTSLQSCSLSSSSWSRCLRNSQFTVCSFSWSDVTESSWSIRLWRSSSIFWRSSAAEANKLLRWSTCCTNSWLDLSLETTSTINEMNRRMVIFQYYVKYLHYNKLN